MLTLVPECLLLVVLNCLTRPTVVLLPKLLLVMLVVLMVT